MPGFGETLRRHINYIEQLPHKNMQPCVTKRLFLNHA